MFLFTLFLEKEQEKRFRQSMNIPGHVKDPLQPDKKHEPDRLWISLAGV
jgi:hypothetical protein